MSGTSAIFRFLAVSAACAAGLSADLLSLTGGDSLSGTVRVARADGSVELETPLSPEALIFKPGSLRAIRFPAAGETRSPGDCLLTLANGDQLPGNVESIDDSTIVFDSPATGRLRIPRAAAASVTPGIRKPVVIATGVGSREDWSMDPNSTRWKFSENSMSCHGRSYVARDFGKLPERFSLGFTVSWREGPYFRCYFASPSAGIDPRADRYFFDMTENGGVSIKRESADGTRYTDIFRADTLPRDFHNQELAVEIRVDRPNRELRVYFNKELQARRRDPLPQPPSGSYVEFRNENPVGSSHVKISGFRLAEWEPTDERTAPERGDPASDTIVSNDGEQFGGSLLSAKRKDGKLQFDFKTAGDASAVEVPEAVVSAVFFATSAPAASPAAPFLLTLRNEGTLHLGQCDFTPGGINASHPLLGSIHIAPDAPSILVTAKAATPKSRKKAAKP